MTDMRTEIPAKPSIEKLEKRLKPSGRHRVRMFFLRAGTQAADLLFRLIELFIALIVTIFLVIPVALVLFLRKLFTGKPVTISRARVIVGKGGRKLSLARFNLARSGWANLLLFIYVLTGKLGIVGASMEDFADHQFTLESGYLHDGRPGIVSLWQVRRNSNIGHEGLAATEWEYRFTHSPGSDLFLILRAIPACFFGKGSTTSPDTINLFDISFANLPTASTKHFRTRTIVRSSSMLITYFRTESGWPLPARSCVLRCARM